MTKVDEAVGSEAPKRSHPIGVRLRAAGLTEVFIVDDAYDPPTVAEDAPTFWAAIRRDAAAKEQLDGVREIAEAADIDEELLGELWRRRGELDRVRGYADEHLFKTKLQQLNDVEVLRKHLRGLEFEPKVCGARTELPATAGLVFLDYVLDPAATMELDELATQKAMALYKVAGGGPKPFIVLMSDRPEAALQRDKFRAKSQLLGGLFGFISKADAVAPEKLFVRLGSWGIGNTTHHDLQTFVDNVLEAVGAAAEDFKQRVLALDVQDYAFIQRLSLHEDGHPLGDYILWLFESSLGYGLRAHDRVRAGQAKLDQMRFDSYLPCQTPPSPRLAEFFLSAVTEPAVGEKRAHPHDPDGLVPLLGLGDIFVKDADGSVFMVVTGACDLAFSPAGGRACDPDQPVYLAPGRLEPIERRGEGDPKPKKAEGSKTEGKKPEAKKSEGKKPERKSSDGVVRTELISYGGKPHRILWDCGHVESRRLGGVWPSLVEAGYEHRWRLRLPYALVVQQAFSNRITRLGMPVPPPIFSQADVMVYRDGGQRRSVAVGEIIREGVVLIHGRDGDHFVLTVDCVSALMQRLDGVAAEEEEKANALDAHDRQYENRRGAIMRSAQAIRDCKNDTVLWLTMLENPTALPHVGEKNVLSAKLLWVYRDGDMSEPYVANTPIVLNIVTSASSRRAAALAEAALVVEDGVARPPA